ncbi:MAG TPA: MFS transporter, partial [Acetobacteraceae bacterium]|nr:MFS transporter [Acetobacteraceae bacterium]
MDRRFLGLVLGINQTLSWGMTFYLPAIVADPVARSFGASHVAVLGAFSWALLITGACMPRVGRWIDRHGGRGSLLTSIVVMSAGQVLLAAAPGLPLWYVGWTVVGIGMAMGLYDAAFATVGNLLGREAGPTITGITLVAGFASTVFWTLGASLIGPFGWRGLLLFYAALMLAVNLPMVWLLVPAAAPSSEAKRQKEVENRQPVNRTAVACLAGFFTLRWFITSAIAVNVLMLLQGIGLTVTESVAVAALIGPGQVAGRVIEWSIGSRVGLLVRARLAALLFPLAAATLPIGGPVIATGFAVLYGMSNGIMTINRGTLPLALFGPAGYATMLGWLAVPVQLAQATAPTLAAPLVSALPALDVF